jgi:hypothetical protein
MQAQFSLGITYWPRRAAYTWWQAFDRSETRDELAHIAALGCNTVRFCLRWEDFQPGRLRINGAALRALEHALDAAYEAGLRVAGALFPVALGGTLQLPAWANEADPLIELRRTLRFGPTLVVQHSDLAPVLYEGSYHTNQARDLFGDASLLEGQRYFIHEVVGYFASHPAIWAWQLGEGLERIRKPDSELAIRDWLAALTETLRARHPNARVLGVTSVRGLTLRAGPRPEHLAEACDLIGVAADPPELPYDDRRVHTTYVTFLHALTAALGGAPAIVTSLGVPTAPDQRAGWIADTAYGRPARPYLADEEEQAEFVGTALELLWRAGARGAWLASYADYPPELWRTPPLDRVTRERTLGLVDAEGREKLAAAVLRAFATRLEAGEAQPTPTPLEVDPERYWREPRGMFEELWKQFSAP